MRSFWLICCVPVITFVAFTLLLLRVDYARFVWLRFACVYLIGFTLPRSRSCGSHAVPAYGYAHTFAVRFCLHTRCLFHARCLPFGYYRVWLRLRLLRAFTLILRCCHARGCSRLLLIDYPTLRWFVCSFWFAHWLRCVGWFGFWLICYRITLILLWLFCYVALPVATVLRWLRCCVFHVVHPVVCWLRSLPPLRCVCTVWLRVTFRSTRWLIFTLPFVVAVFVDYTRLRCFAFDWLLITLHVCVVGWLIVTLLFVTLRWFCLPFTRLPFTFPLPVAFTVTHALLRWLLVCCTLTRSIDFTVYVWFGCSWFQLFAFYVWLLPRRLITFYVSRVVCLITHRCICLRVPVARLRSPHVVYVLLLFVWLIAAPVCLVIHVAFVLPVVCVVRTRFPVDTPVALNTRVGLPRLERTVDSYAFYAHVCLQLRWLRLPFTVPVGWTFWFLPTVVWVTDLHPICSFVRTSVLPHLFLRPFTFTTFAIDYRFYADRFLFVTFTALLVLILTFTFYVPFLTALLPTVTVTRYVTFTLYTCCCTFYVCCSTRFPRCLPVVLPVAVTFVCPVYVYTVHLVLRVVLHLFRLVTFVARVGFGLFTLFTRLDVVCYWFVLYAHAFQLILLPFIAVIVDALVCVDLLVPSSRTHLIYGWCGYTLDCFARLRSVLLPRLHYVTIYPFSAGLHCRWLYGCPVTLPVTLIAFCNVYGWLIAVVTFTGCVVRLVDFGWFVLICWFTFIVCSPPALRCSYLICVDWLIWLPRSRLYGYVHTFCYAVIYVPTVTARFDFTAFRCWLFPFTATLLLIVHLPRLFVCVYHGWFWLRVCSVVDFTILHDLRLRCWFACDLRLFTTRCICSLPFTFAVRCTLFAFDYGDFAFYVYVWFVAFAVAFVAFAFTDFAVFQLVVYAFTFTFTFWFNVGCVWFVLTALPVTFTYPLRLPPQLVICGPFRLTAYVALPHVIYVCSRFTRWLLHVLRTFIYTGYAHAFTGCVYVARCCIYWLRYLPFAVVCVCFVYTYVHVLHRTRLRTLIVVGCYHTLRLFYCCWLRTLFTFCYIWFCYVGWFCACYLRTLHFGSWLLLYCCVTVGYYPLRAGLRFVVRLRALRAAVTVPFAPVTLIDWFYRLFNIRFSWLRLRYAFFTFSITLLVYAFALRSAFWLVVTFCVGYPLVYVYTHVLVRQLLPVTDTRRLCRVTHYTAVTPILVTRFTRCALSCLPLRSQFAFAFDYCARCYARCTRYGWIRARITRFTFCRAFTLIVAFVRYLFCLPYCYPIDWWIRSVWLRLLRFCRSRTRGYPFWFALRVCTLVTLIGLPRV